MISLPVYVQGPNNLTWSELEESAERRGSKEPIVVCKRNGLHRAVYSNDSDAQHSPPATDSSNRE